MLFTFHLPPPPTASHHFKSDNRKEANIKDPQKSRYRVMIENLCSSVNKTGLKSQPHCAILDAISNLNFFVLK